MMANELIAYMDGVEFDSYLTLADKESRAISGHSSGGYGAFRLAMKYDTLFNSVSAIDAPLAFDGDCATCGIKSLFDPYLNESGIDSDQEFFATDTTGFRSQPYKLLLYSMAASFTPAPINLETKLGLLRISLPFDYQGETVQPYWDEWLANDLTTWLSGPDAATYQSRLNVQNIHLESSDHDPNGFNRQTVLFGNRLTQLGINHEAVTFTKYPGYDARSRSFLYDRFEAILKFHDKYLKDRDGNF